MCMVQQSPPAAAFQIVLVFGDDTVIRIPARPGPRQGDVLAPELWIVPNWALQAPTIPNWALPAGPHGPPSEEDVEDVD